MMRMKARRLFTGAVAALWLVGCSGSSSSSGPLDAGADAAGPGAPADGGTACVFSYQCPASTYCSLQQCTQDCNTKKACADGLVCTERGRCAASAAAPSDPPSTPQPGQLTASTTLVNVKPTDTSFTLTLTGSGTVNYRLASDSAWVIPPVARAVLSGSASLTFKVKPATAPAGQRNATVHVYSDQGDLAVSVSTMPSLQGVWAGSVTFASVNLTPGATATPVPLALGQVQLGLHIRTDAPGIRAEVDAVNSTLWAAPSSGPAAGAGTMQANGSVVFTLAEVIDGQPGAPASSLYSADSPSVFGSTPSTAREIGRRLQLTLTLASDGTLSGSTAETIYGLTSTPVEIDGTASFRLNSAATVASFGMPAAITMPTGPTRGIGAAPVGCPSLSAAGFPVLSVAGAGYCAGTTAEAQWECVAGDGTTNSGELQVGFPLDPFYTASPQGGFSLTAVPMGATSAYEAASTLCSGDVGTNPRVLSAPALMTGSTEASCADTAAIDCGRYLAGATLATTHPALASQGAMYAAQAYAELFELLGNQSAVTALGDRLSATTPTTTYRGDILSSRTFYDDALFYIFDPRLFEELRATTASNAQVGPLPEANDRTALRRAAESLTRSAQETAKALQIDFSSTTNATALHASAQADATLYFIQAALLADLEARWRTGISTPLPEVAQFASMISGYDQQLQGISSTATPLGVPTAYVPLLANSASGPGSTTNYERLYAIAQTSVATSVAADQAAADDVRLFDTEEAAVTQQIEADETAQLATIRGICGDSFIVGGAPNPDITQCGANTGSLNAAGIALQGANLTMQAAQQALEAQYDLLNDQLTAFAEIADDNASEVQFVTKSNKVIFGLTLAQSVLQAASAVVTAYGTAVDGFEASRPWTVGGGSLLIAGGALQAAADLFTPFITLEQGLEQDYELKTTAATTNITNNLTVQQTALQFAGLTTQVSIALNGVGSAASVAATLAEQVKNAEQALTTDQLAIGASITSDPSYRVIEQAAAQTADQDLASAQLALYYAARGLEYETNTSLTPILTQVYSATNAAQLSSLQSCLANAWTSWQLLVSSGNNYVTEVSLAKDVFGITGTVTDPKTKQLVSAGDQFRHYLFAQPYSPDAAHVWSAVDFGTALDDESSLFSSLVCDDRIVGIEAQLVGTGLKGSTAELQVLVDGVTTLRSCAATDTIVAWDLRPAGSLAPAVIETGVNAYPTGVAPNQSLYDYGVAQSHWIVAIPDAQTSPANASIDESSIDDIVLRITHTGQAVGSATSTFNPTCN
jgi:hypothetical protein